MEMLVKRFPASNGFFFGFREQFQAHVKAKRGLVRTFGQPPRMRSAQRRTIKLTKAKYYCLLLIPFT